MSRMEWRPPTAAKRAEMGAALCGRYPMLERFPIGKSACGRDIDGFMLGQGAHSVLFVGGTHAQEWLTVLLVYRFMEDVCAHVESGKAACRVAIGKAMHGRSLLFVPALNPDGIEIALAGSGTAGKFAASVASLGGDTAGLWQANARGVDLNHNFRAGWEQLHALEQQSGILSPAARRYGGFAPESEPETAAVAALCRRVRPAHALSLHTQGEVIYWRYGHRTPEQARLMAQVLAQAAGYTLDDPEGLAQGGGFKDWFIEEFARPAFTVECGKGENPLPLADFSAVYERVRELLFTAAVL